VVVGALLLARGRSAVVVGSAAGREVLRGAGATGSATTRTTGGAVLVDNGVGAVPMLTGAPVCTAGAGVAVRATGSTGPPSSAQVRPAEPTRATTPSATRGPLRRGELCRPIIEVSHSEGRHRLVAAWAG
jgi:hypothetical protein